MADKNDSAVPGAQDPANRHQQSGTDRTEVREIDPADTLAHDTDQGPRTPAAASSATASASALGIKPLNRYGALSRSGAEAFGSFILVLGGVAASMFGGQGGMPAGFAFGLILIAALIAVGHVSGGHFNPAITLGHAVAGRMSWKDVLPYMVAQVVGGALAMGLLWVVLSGSSRVSEQSRALFSSVSNGFGEHSPLMFPLTSVLLLEVILTAVFLGVFLGATSSTAHKALAPIAIGLVYAVLIQVALPISGAGLNPARSTATVFFAEGWAVGQLWLFWVAPLAGALIAGLIYRSIEPAPALTPVTGTAADADTTTTATTTATTGAHAAAAGDSGTVRPAGIAPAQSGAESGSDAGTGSASDEAAYERPRSDDAQRFFDGDTKK